jgi:hypothetical protein
MSHGKPRRARKTPFSLSIQHLAPHQSSIRPFAMPTTFLRPVEIGRNRTSHIHCSYCLDPRHNSIGQPMNLSRSSSCACAKHRLIKSSSFPTNELATLLVQSNHRSRKCGYSDRNVGKSLIRTLSYGIICGTIRESTKALSLRR